MDDFFGKITSPFQFNISREIVIEWPKNYIIHLDDIVIIPLP